MHTFIFPTLSMTQIYWTLWFYVFKKHTCTFHPKTKFNFAIENYIHGILTCVNKNRLIKETKSFCNNKIELRLIEIYFQQPICLINIYATPFEHVSTIIAMIRKAKCQTTHVNCVFLIIGDFNIDIQLKQLAFEILKIYMKTENLQEITSKLCPQ